MVGRQAQSGKIVAVAALRDFGEFGGGHKNLFWIPAFAGMTAEIPFLAGMTKFLS